ncbi:hypothetical protein B9Z19DRAFT_1063934 [Tuber borchii]|uniref:Uncharacterized protein n=1 Tax=Tuber borchii TaxID=42251 RepID=A0A2T6ZWI8_TUBBO|nr:hypothetical protein B9Z19DRAFT_1063934 [Tuber borchii]
MGSTLSADSRLKAAPSCLSTATHALTLQGRSHSFNIHGAAGSQVATSVEPTMGLANAATLDTSHIREPISRRIMFKIRLGRRKINGEEIIYEEEEEEEEEETDDDRDDDDEDDYHEDRELEQSSDRLRAGEISGSSLGRISWNLARSHSAPFTWGLYGDVSENCFWVSTQEIGEMLLGQAMTPKDFFISPNDQQDSIKHIITKRNCLFAGNARHIIDLEAATREETEGQGIDLEEMDRIDHEIDRQAFLNLSW